MEHIYHLPHFGEEWFTYPNLYRQFVNILLNGSKIVEVGSWKGKSTAFLAVEIINSGKDIEIHAVDTWRGSPEHSGDPYIQNDTLYDLFLSNISPVSSVIRPVRKASIEAAKDYQDYSVDVVFIDACHEYDCVKEDIAAWYPKVKSGGIISGHDYGDYCHNVVRAVNESLPKERLEVSEYCWMYIKP